MNTSLWKTLSVHWSIRVYLIWLVVLLALIIGVGIYAWYFREFQMVTSALLGDFTWSSWYYDGSLYATSGYIVLVMYGIIKAKKWGMLLLMTNSIIVIILTTWSLYRILFQSQLDWAISNLQYYGLLTLGAALVVYNIILAYVALLRFQNLKKDILNIPEKYLQDTPVNLYKNLLHWIIIIAFIIAGLLYIRQPLIPSGITDAYMKIDGFSIENPTYTESTWCANLKNLSESYKEYQIQGSSVLQNRLSEKYPALKTYFRQNFSEKYRTTQLQLGRYSSEKNEYDLSRSLFSEYIEEYPNDWRKAVEELDLSIPTWKIDQLITEIWEIPTIIRCQEKNDILALEFKANSYVFKLSRAITSRIEIDYLKKDYTPVIKNLKFLRKLNQANLDGSLSIEQLMLWVESINREIKIRDYILENVPQETEQEIRKIYQVKADFQIPYRNAYKGSYYWVSHLFWGRKVEPHKIWIPFIYSWEESADFFKAIMVYYMDGNTTNEWKQATQYIEKNIAKKHPLFDEASIVHEFSEYYPKGYQGVEGKKFIYNKLSYDYIRNMFVEFKNYKIRFESMVSNFELP